MMPNQVKYAVGMFMWRRKANIEAILKQVIAYEPPCLFLFFDGPRNPEEQIEINRVKGICMQLLQQVTFKVEMDEFPSHGGLNKRFRTGLHRLFSEVPCAIILEDDTVPNPSFFEYCTFYLTHFYHRDDIVALNGFYKKVSMFEANHSPESPFTNYIFNPWGWASWAHKFTPLYNPDIKTISWWQAIRVFMLWKNFDIFQLRRRLLRDVENGKLHTWDVQLQWSLFLAGKKVLTPPVNLIQNVGNDHMASTFVAGASDFEQKANHLAFNQLKQTVPHRPDYDLALCKSKRNLKFIKKMLWK
ncbi:MAG: hypothetical protein FGM54_03340 [Chitinophagaceae bacterium]|nr:hypothetical protein [Chitinophagaceae bacterium]